MCKDFITDAKNTLVTHKKKIWSVVIVVAVLAALSAGAHAMFRVSGVVTAVDQSSVTVANFFRTQTVDLINSPVNTVNIRPGDRIMIQKNLQGEVIYIRAEKHRDGERQHRQMHQPGPKQGE